MTIEQLAGELLNLEHWPWLSVLVILTTVGQFTTLKLFTRQRAYNESLGKMRHFFFWGRETLILHPLCAAAVLAVTWTDPEGKGWALAPSFAYYGTAAVASLFAWTWFRARAKKRGMSLSLPGMSAAPLPKFDDDDVGNTTPSGPPE